MILNYKYKLQHNDHRFKKLRSLMFLANAVYNHCIALQKRHYRRYGTHISKYTLQNHIKKMKNRCYMDWKPLGAQCIQDQISRVDKSYRAFFGHLKAKRSGKKRPPKFRPFRKAKSFTYTQNGYKLHRNTIRLSGIATTFKFHKCRSFNGKIKTVTIKRNPLGEWYLVICVDSEKIHVKPKQRTGKSAGLDFGMTTFLTTDSAQTIHNIRPLEQSIKEYKRASRKLSKAKKSSNNRKRRLMHMLRIHKRVAHVRENYHWQLAHELLNQYDNIFIEDLCMNGMKALWGKKVSDYGFSDFVKKLEWLAVKHDKTVLKVDRFFASTKICNSCKEKTSQKLDLKVRKWTCEHCNTAHDRDVNAANNILEAGNRLIQEKKPLVNSQELAKLSSLVTEESGGSLSRQENQALA